MQIGEGGGGIILVKVFKICQEINEDSIIPRGIWILGGGVHFPCKSEFRYRKFVKGKLRM